MGREDGFYWIKVCNEWIVGHYIKGYWGIVVSNEFLRVREDEVEFQSIGSRIENLHKG